MSGGWSTLAATFGALAGLMFAVWAASVVKRDASIIDAAWGMSFVVVAWLAAWLNKPATERTLAVASLTTIWGVRLSAYLLWRNWGQGEDRRYQAMRARRGAQFWWISLATVFGLQAAIAWFVSLPLQVAAIRGLERPWGVLDGLGVLAWLVGFTFETVGDWQLARFRAEPSNAGRVMDRGLWRYTRHPNYFGDFCAWWGLYLIAAGGGAWFTVLSPLLMTILLVRVSGVALLEETIGRRRPGYAEYRVRTNAFFPGPPRGGLGN